MKEIVYYGLIFVVLLVIELIYFKLAKYFNIVDKPNQRSSHSVTVLRGGGIIFTLSVLAWTVLQLFKGEVTLDDYLPFIIGLSMVSLTSFIDDIISLKDSTRLVVQFISIILMFYSLDIFHLDLWLLILISLIVCVGIINVYNFMDGINGMTGGYSLIVLISLLVLNCKFEFVSSTFLYFVILSLIVFCVFNFRPKGFVKCFAGDVGSIGIAFIILYLLGRLIICTEDVTYLLLLVVYGVDACMTILHRIILRENLGEAHRKHMYQIMANELKIGHLKVSSFYMIIQTLISGCLIILPNSIFLHWIYLFVIVLVLIILYLLFMKKFYHLHEEYLKNNIKKS